MLQDCQGVPVSTKNPAALRLYETALHQFHCYVGDPLETIDSAIAEDPDFVLGHIFRATMLALLSEAQYLPEIRRSIREAQVRIGAANDREKGLLSAVKNWADGHLFAACRDWERVLVDNPRDAFALQSAHLTDFYTGDAKNLCDRVARVLPAWSSDFPSYSYLLGMYAFGLEECNLYQKAEATGREALELEPGDGWAVHAVAHVMEMQGRFEDGIQWLETREQDWSPDNGFAFHNWWHLALYYLEKSDYGKILQLFDEHIYPEPADMSLQMVDASALLWRLYLQDIDTGRRWQTLAQVWEDKAETENGYYAFNDVHAMMAYVATDRQRAADTLLGDMSRKAAAGHSDSAIMLNTVGIPLARALAAFGRQAYDEVVENLLAVRGIANRFGGSHAQRDVINLTLIEAAIRGGRSALAQHLLNERIAYKPGSPLARNLVSRARCAAAGPAGGNKAAGKIGALIN